MDINILHLFRDEALQGICQDVLANEDLAPFDAGRFPNADLVLTDSGLTSGSIPGFVPVLLMAADDEPYPESFYTRVIDKDLSENDLQDEINHSAKEAAVAREVGLHEAVILQTDRLNELVEMGGERIVRDGLRNFMKNTTLELNECRWMLERESYDEIRFAIHRLKGNAATIGGDQLARLFEDMEVSLKSENYSNFDEKLKLAYTLLASFSYLSNGWYSE